MPATTPNRGYPYPIGTDTNADYPITEALQRLAEEVNDDVQTNLVPSAATQRPRGHMRSSGTQTIQRNLETALTFQLQFADTDNMVDTVTLPTVLTVNTPGVYLFHMFALIPDINWTNLVFRMMLNSTTEVFVTDQEFRTGAQQFISMPASWMWPMAAGDTMSVTLQHNASGPLWVTAREFLGMRMAT